MTPSAPRILRFRDLVVGYGRHRVAGPLEGSWSGGELLLLTGPNGSGKTTLARTLLGFVRPLVGRIEGLAGHAVSYVPQLGRIDPGFPVTVAEVVGTGHRRRVPRATRRLRSQDALERVGLTREARRPFSRLSGGQRQRVLVARAFAAEAEIVVLDEPTAGVDADSSGQVWTHLRAMADTGVLVVVVTHDLFHGPTVADRVLVLDAGRLSERAHA